MKLLKTNHLKFCPFHCKLKNVIIFISIKCAIFCVAQCKKTDQSTNVVLMMFSLFSVADLAVIFCIKLQEHELGRQYYQIVNWRFQILLILPVSYRKCHFNPNLYKYKKIICRANNMISMNFSLTKYICLGPINQILSSFNIMFIKICPNVNVLSISWWKTFLCLRSTAHLENQYKGRWYLPTLPTVPTLMPTLIFVVHS